jgi:menaquinone-dependent protoporphyrinogen oxidase
LKVLVAYASRTGFTKGIAEFIGKKLQERGIQTDVQEAANVRDATQYDAFAIGSPVYMFHWLKEAKGFVSRNQALLAGHPVWLFSSGPVGTKPTNDKGQDLLEVSGPSEIGELRESVKARDYRMFFGGLDGSRLKGTVGFVYKTMMRSKSVRESMPEGDFRDWKAIEEWANGIADALQIQSPA